VEARYTRRGGLDINPWRASPGSALPRWVRDERQ
jgi:7-cyano-7-deazaguanine reductase